MSNNCVITSNCKQHFTDSEKEVIFECYTNHQRGNYLPPPEYSYQAYADSVYLLWLAAIDKNVKVIINELGGTTAV